MSITTWDVSPKHEVAKILWTCYQMANGFYGDHNLLVLPLGTTSSIKIPVFLPDLAYISIPHYWDIVGKLDPDPLYTKTDTNTESKLLELILSTNLPKPKYEDVKKLWKVAEQEVFRTIYDIVPECSDGIHKVTIYPTVSGTRSTFEVPTTLPADIQIFLREGEGIHTIAEAIVTSLIKPGIEKHLNGKWLDSEMVVDWIITRSKLADVLRKFDPQHQYLPTTHSVTNVQYGPLIQISKQFYKKIGLSQNTKLEKILNIQDLTYNERRVLSSLVLNEGKIVSFDDVGDILFDDKDKFSLYALAKTIERIRKKLHTNGYPHTLLQTVRGKGYLLQQ